MGFFLGVPVGVTVGAVLNGSLQNTSLSTPAFDHTRWTKLYSLQLKKSLLEFPRLKLTGNIGLSAPKAESFIETF
jgi:hypothetical protein